MNFEEQIEIETKKQMNNVLHAESQARRKLEELERDRKSKVDFDFSRLIERFERKE